MVVNVGSSSRSADERGAVVRKLVTLLVAVVVLGIAAPASAVDDEFRGRYRARWRPVEGLCSPVRHMVSIRYTGELRRLTIRPVGSRPGRSDTKAGDTHGCGTAVWKEPSGSTIARTRIRRSDSPATRIAPGTSP
ncbi:MAG: hypothetical protein ACXWYN_06630 [Actinomycetota bacterium]